MSEPTTTKEYYDQLFKDFSAVCNPLILGFIGTITFGLEQKIFWLLVLAWAINETICSLIKLTWYRPRPVPMVWHTWGQKILASSMPSIHASRISVITTFVVLLDTTVATKVLFVIAGILIGYSRIHLRKHFWVDVIAGWIIGMIIALIVIRFSGI